MGYIIQYLFSMIEFETLLLTENDSDKELLSDQSSTQKPHSKRDFLDSPFLLFTTDTAPLPNLQIESPLYHNPFHEEIPGKGKETKSSAEMERKKEMCKKIKSTNMPKFMIKLFREYIASSKEVYEEDQNQFLRTKKILVKLLKEKKQQQININLGNLKQIFGRDEDCKGKKRKHLNRIAMRKIISENITQIIANSRIPQLNKPLYYKILRTYGYRLQNPELSGRIQLH